MTAVVDSVEMVDAQLADTQVVDGRYRLGAVLGRGASSTVHLARDTRLDRDVAVKLVRGDDERRRRGANELAVLAGLSHTSVVKVFDGGHGSDGYGWFAYLVLEHVPGRTLLQAGDGCPLDRVEVQAVARDLAHALAYLDSVGVVHGDLEPGNVLLPGRGPVHAKLAGFGRARTGRGGPDQVFALGALLRPYVPESWGPRWRALLAAMLDSAPADRPTPLEVVNALSDVETATLSRGRWRASRSCDRRGRAGRPFRR